MKVILEAPLHDKDCVLGNILAAHYLSSCDPSKVNLYVKSASSKLERSTPYEKAVFETVTYLISEDKDDDLAFEMHIELLKRFPKDLVYLKRAQVLSFQMAKPVPFLNLVQQVLPENQDESYIHGMLAFPLLELGRMEEAAAASRKGYGINKEDALAHHCVYLNALGLFLRLDVRDVLDGFKDRLELLAARLTDQVLSYGRNMKVILEAPLHDKDCVLGNILAAHYLSSCDPSKVNLYVKSASSKLERSTPYEKAVFETVTYLISEDKDDDLAFEMHIELLKRFPKDLVYLKRAQVLSFQMAKPVPFLNLVQQVLPENQDESYIHGMLAFPLLELGRMEEAAAASRKGYGINKEDALAHHCFCHVLQHKCHFKEAVEFMEELAEY
uniref:Uncharacterized protein n=1 Tax=Brassica campestris TaxID=3711 RepID=M4F6M3_BRACM